MGQTGQSETEAGVPWAASVLVGPRAASVVFGLPNTNRWLLCYMCSRPSTSPTLSWHLRPCGGLRLHLDTCVQIPAEPLTIYPLASAAW